VVANESDNTGPFDVRTIRHLVSLMSRHDLSEIDLREGTTRIRLRRGSAAPAAPIPMALPIPAPTASAAPEPAVPRPTPAEPDRKLHEIKSPTPGTFYNAPTPGAEPFVKVGSRVTPTTVVCIIEAMKIFNEIPADCTGVITEIVVENQQPVEYGQVLFRVDPNG
jgi:acetyl-CoA carboxylase biotin carboxyl carrier protein